MTIRENLEQWEKDYLSPYASLSVNSKGRLRPEEPVSYTHLTLPTTPYV